MTVQCGICNKRCGSIGLLTRHRSKAHPKAMAKSNALSVAKTRVTKNGQAKANGNGRGNGHSNGHLSAQDLIDILKVKRDALSDMIAEAERVIS